MMPLQRLEELTRELEAEELEKNTNLTVKDLIALLDFCLDGWWIYNINTGYDYLSKQWCETLGYAQDELEHHVDTWLRLIHPDDKLKAEKALLKHIEDGTPYELTARYKHKDGHWVTLHDKGKVIRRDSEDVATIVAGYERLFNGKW